MQASQRLDVPEVVSGARRRLTPRLEQDLATVRAELAKERQGRIEAEQQAAVLAAQKVDLEGRLADAKRDAERTAEQLQKVQVRAEQQAEALADARVTVQTAQGRFEHLAAQHEACIKDAESARAAAKAAGEEAAKLRGQLDAVAKGKAPRG